MDLQLNNKTAFISGSTAGIGLATAKRLAAEGATVIINGRTQQSVDQAVKQLQSETGNPNVSGIVADFSSVEDISKLIAQLPDIDILVNNTGIFEPKPFAEIPDEDWFRFFDINVMSGVRLSRHFFPKMVARNWGRIIFISSESGIMIPDEMIHYGMTKSAQLAVSSGLAQLTKGTNVTVNSILPGPTKSRGVGQFLEDLAAADSKSVAEVEADFFSKMRPGSLIQRFASVEEIANTVAYYVSPLASATNGAAIRVEGGLVRSIV
ncbi:SDR family NAD(P)-dependent oxidoreductase [Flavobacterium caeni]|uniref:NAD(P)-dependent dehydrogenase, short-chain alcohol dehydrogenase family n=1 Tax=Flavobacterium caeni TaxID=490189 RepID=A0A1G5AS13_9FLAO|nr:SDR family oxidoreductase [Flavobacterium caeni]SCX80631.1 NAD(P)-dependent dehydrogenase, short-chain alcohol dehydrogenase family [Flavobacterium caeni]